MRNEGNKEEEGGEGEGERVDDEEKCTFGFFRCILENLV